MGIPNRKVAQNPDSIVCCECLWSLPFQMIEDSTLLAHSVTHWRATPPDFLEKITKIAYDLGVTRLANLTRLDRLNIPVWQAVRPLSKSLSVHQGKGWRQQDAQIGALMEAIESAIAEQPLKPFITSLLLALPTDKKPYDITDFLLTRKRRLDAPIAVDWCLATSLTQAADFLVPMPCISMDFTQDIGTDFDKSSNGLASGSCLSEAILSGLCEVIERDLTVAWWALSADQRRMRRLDLRSIEFCWLKNIMDAVDRAGLSLACWDISPNTELPAFTCCIVDMTNETGFSLPPVEGYACHPLAEVALSAAILEAVQSRLTVIAGARDDIQPITIAAIRESQRVTAFRFMRPLGIKYYKWRNIKNHAGAAASKLLSAMIAKLKRCGVHQIGYINLAASSPDISVVKVIIPGAGMDERSSRLSLKQKK